jgi:hypothetical protein
MSYLKLSNMLLDSLSKSWEKVGKMSPEAKHYTEVAAEVMALKLEYFGF